jgi:large subunit ribosomal protein L25
MHPTKPQVLHVDLQRISATEKIHMRVPLHFVGGDVAPGVKQEGGIVSHQITEIDITCLPHQLPEYLEVDISQLHLNDSVHLSDVKLPEGVTIPQLAHDDLAVATITAVTVEEEAPEAAAESVAPAAAEAAAPGAPAPAAAEAKKPEGKK